MLSPIPTLRMLGSSTIMVSRGISICSPRALLTRIGMLSFSLYAQMPEVIIITKNISVALVNAFGFTTLRKLNFLDTSLVSKIIL